MKIGVGAFANGCHRPGRIAASSQDHSCLGADGTYAAQQFQAFVAVAALPGQHQVALGMAQRLQRFVPVVSVLNRASFALQHGSQKLVEGGIGIEDQ